MTIAIESLSLLELKAFLREQALDVFPALQDENRLTMLAEKWHTHAEFCTSRDENRRLVGMIAFYANLSETGVAYLPHVYVSPYHRREGLFSKMLDFIEGSIRRRGFNEIKLEVDRNNFKAQAVYEKNGFSIIGGASLTSWYMVKNIKME